MIRNHRVVHPALFLLIGCIGCTVSSLLPLQSAIAFEDVEKTPRKPTLPTSPTAHQSVSSKNVPTEKKNPKPVELPANRRHRTIKTVAVQLCCIGYDSLQSMEDAADVVVIGVPTEDFLDRRHIVQYSSNGLVNGSTTETTIRITRIIKAQNRSQLLREGTVRFIEPIGLIEQGEDLVRLKYDQDYNELKQGKTYLLFLGRMKSGTLSVINMNEGKLAVQHSVCKFSNLP